MAKFATVKFSDQDYNLILQHTDQVMDFYKKGYITLSDNCIKNTTTYRNKIVKARSESFALPLEFELDEGRRAELQRQRRNDD